jgi:putative phage-type endonuclease
MSDAEWIQGSEAWLQARVGSLGASRVHDVITKTKTGWGASRGNLMAELLCERLTGQRQEGFTNAAMAWGTAQEPAARTAYARRAGVDVTETGIVRHPEIAWTHASPDGLVGEDGLLEIKAPNTLTHLETLETGAIPAKYITQMQWQITCTGRAWCDFVSFDPRLPPHLSLFIKRVPRDVSMIVDLETEVTGFLAELDARIAGLTARYEAAA